MKCPVLALGALLLVQSFIHSSVAAGLSAPPASPKAAVSAMVTPQKTSRSAKISPRTETDAPHAGTLVEVCSLRSLTCLPTPASGRIAPVDLSSAVKRVAAGMRGAACDLPLPKAAVSGLVEPAEVYSQLGATAPFSLKENGRDFYIYSPRDRLTKKDAFALSGLEQRLEVVIAAMSANSLSMQLPVPHAGTFADLVSAVRAITPSVMQVEAVAGDQVRISSTSAPDCETLKTFLADLTHLAHRTHPDSGNASVFFLDLASVGAAVHATPIPFAQGGAATASAAGSSDTSPAKTTDGDPATAKGGGAANTKKKNAGIKPVKASGEKAAVSKIKTPTTDDAASADQAISPNSVEPDTKAETPSASAQPPAFSVNGKDLLFPAGTPGDDGAITEKKRIVALLDLPQPQVLINAWVMQNSTSKAQDFGKLTTLVHQSVNEHNAIIEFSIFQGWAFLQQMTQRADYFDVSFYNYLTQRTVFEPRPSAEGSRLGNAPAAAQWLKETAGTPSAGAPDASTGVCDRGKYCLGYTTLFRALQPRLTDLLLTLIAAREPYAAATGAIEAMKPRPVNPVPNQRLRSHFAFFKSGNPLPQGCEEQDEADLVMAQGNNSVRQDLPLHCFLEAMLMLRGPSEPLVVIMAPGYSNQPPVDPHLPSQLGPMRAAVADFLFNYKLSQQYPHEFAPYDLTQSAQALDGALAPFIEAFNHDLQAFQSYLRASLDTSMEAEKLTRDKNTFLNDGIITVRTTSGDAASVNATSQSYLNVSKAPTISDLVSNIVNSKPGGQSSGPLSGIAGNLSFNEAQVVLGALQSYQTTEANIGRQLNLTVKPRSLLGASAAEMDVRLNADDTPTSPNYWTPGAGGGAKGSADISRVAQHDVTSHVRVDSIKLFEISSFTSILSKGRDKFPLLPPFVELPYIGTLAGIPLAAAKEYHNSTAIISAVIVPTATDIAYSLRFAADRVIVGKPGPACTWTPTAGQPTCTVRKAVSLADFAGESPREFHRLKLFCLATLGASPYATAGGALASTDRTEADCKNLTFASTLHEEVD